MLQFVSEALREAILLTIWGSFWSSNLMDLVLKSWLSDQETSYSFDQYTYSLGPDSKVWYLYPIWYKIPNVWTLVLW